MKIKFKARNYICPQCLMRWDEDIGKCPCTTDSSKPAFVTRLETFLKAVDLDWLKWQIEEYCEMPWKDKMLKEIEELKDENKRVDQAVARS